MTSPYGTMIKGGKLKQRHKFGNLFRENAYENIRETMIRNDQNMRSKWK